MPTPKRGDIPPFYSPELVEAAAAIRRRAEEIVRERRDARDLDRPKALPRAGTR